VGRVERSAVTASARMIFSQLSAGLPWRSIWVRGERHGGDRLRDLRSSAGAVGRAE
jgi:hypothetical protein